jgi:hypothetical protein
MTTTARLTAQLKLLIRAELVAQCKQMKEQDRPFNVNNPGDDTHFHKVVTDIQQDMLLFMAEAVEERLIG